MPRTSSGVSLAALYVTETLAATGNTLLMVGIFFYTNRRFQWGMKENFLLALAQGMIYVAGALLAQRVARQWGRRRVLGAMYLAAATVAAAALLHTTATLVTAALLLYTLFMAITWPAMESLVSSGADPRELSRRLAIYNLTWSLVSAATLAATGTIIQHWPAGVFLLPIIVHVLGAALICANRPADHPLPAGGPAPPHRAPEAQLLRQRRLALWLSRIALPATYMVIYGMMPIFPSLPIMRHLSSSQGTLLASAWLGARWLTFLLLGATTWWHTRPRALLWAAVMMLLAFLGTVLSGNRDDPDMRPALFSMILWQAMLGVALGMIYSGSLYFGMVLSEGSTEHGGYHEALIGLGEVLGPAAGTLAQWARPGDVYAGAVAVACVIAVTVVAAAVASVRLRQT